MAIKSAKLGVMPPLTGLVGIYGTEISRAARIACQEVNENGGVLGRPLELIIEDDGSLPESAVAVATRLVDEYQCNAIIGNLLSNSRIAVAYRVAEPKKIPYLNFSFYEGSILSRYFFHFAALPNQQIDKMIPYMFEKYGSRMFFAGNNYEWPRGSIDAAKRALLKLGGEVLGEMYTPIGVSQANIDDLLDNVEKADPDVFVPYFAGADQVTLLTRFTERGLKQRMAVVMGHYDELLASKLTPEIREGFYSSNTYFMTVDTVENENYLTRMLNYPGVSGIWPGGNGILTNFGEGTYVCVKAFARAANLAGSLDAEALVDALNTLTVYGPQGEVRMDPVTQHARVNTYLSRCSAEGRFEIVEKFGALDPAIPVRYSHQRISHQATLEDDIRLQARMLEQMSEGVMLINSSDQNVIYTNVGAEKLFGYDKNELLGRHISELDISTDDISEAQIDIGAILSGQGYWQGEFKKVRKDGAAVWCAASFSIFTHPVHGEVWLAVYNDITIRKQAEGKNQQLSERLNMATQAAGIGIWDWDICNNILEWDERMFELYGVSRGKFSGAYEAWVTGVHPEDRERCNSAVQDAVHGNSIYKIEFRVLWPDGTVRFIKADGHVVRDAHGNPTRMIGTNYDITSEKESQAELIRHQDHLEDIVAERTNELRTINDSLKASMEQLQQAQAQLVQSEKMASLGGLVAGIAHEINTPVGVGVTAISHLELKLEDYIKLYKSGELTGNDYESLIKSVRESSHIVHKNLIRAADLIRSFKQVAIDQASDEIREFNLSKYLGEVLQSLKPNLKKAGHSVEVNCPDSIMLVSHPGALSRVITNLVMNSLIHGFSDDESGHISIQVTQSNYNIVNIKYSDNGQGLSPEVRANIFEPFFTTARNKGNSGLGMHIVYNLVNQSLGGSITIGSQSNKGVEFIIELPMLSQQQKLAG